MSALKARAALERIGLTHDEFHALHAALTDHADVPRGVQLNGGCHDGRCDKVPGSPKCMAWTRLLELLTKLADKKGHDND